MEWKLIHFVSVINVKKLYSNGPNGPNGPGRAILFNGLGRAGPGRKKSARAHLYAKSLNYFVSGGFIIEAVNWNNIFFFILTSWIIFL